MARRRMIDPEFFLDEEISSYEPHVRLLYIGLWTICDDNFATMPFRPEWIKAQIFPYEQVEVSPMISMLIDAKKLVEFTDKETGKKYLFIANFFKYQRVDKPSKPKYPRYPRDNIATDSRHPLSQVKLSKVKLSKEKLIYDRFEEFWKEYPKKVAKKKAQDVWMKISPNEELTTEIITAVIKSRKSADWLKDGGQFVPHPTTYLNQERWKDEVKEVNKKIINLK